MDASDAAEVYRVVTEHSGECCGCSRDLENILGGLAEAFPDIDWRAFQ